MALPMHVQRAPAVDGEESDRQTKGDKPMKRYMAVVVAVVMAAGTASVVLADSEGEGYGTLEWTNPGSASGSAALQTEPGQVRGPVETGVLPDQSVKAEHGGWLNMDVSEQDSSPELRGRPNIQAP
jgi:hypothetical protein